MTGGGTGDSRTSHNAHHFLNSFRHRMPMLFMTRQPNEGAT